MRQGFGQSDRHPARSASNIHYRLARREIIIAGYPSTIGISDAMQAAKKLLQFILAHAFIIVRCLRLSRPDRFCDLKSSDPEVGLHFMPIPPVTRTTSHQVIIGFGRVGEELVFHCKQADGDQRIEQGAQLDHLYSKRCRDLARAQRAILERRKQIELHPC